MKRSFLLLETLFSFCIIGIVFFFSTVLYSNILQNNKKTYELAIARMDLFSTQIFIEKQLKQGVLLDVTSQNIRFYALDTEEFLQGFYSGITDLTKSSKSKVYTPNSQTTQLKSNFILFNDTTLYELIQSSENNVLYFKDASPKTIYEHYKIVKNISNIRFVENALYLNDHLLQNQITQFDASLVQNRVHVHICIQQLCEDWIF